MNKKTQQLGMDAGTASGRLVKDLLFDFIKDIPCYRCGQLMTRDTFSIEHKQPWLDSPNPVELFFDIANISYSHKACNSRASRNPRQKYFTADEQRAARNKRYRKYRASKSESERKQIRRAQYLRTGK